VKDLAENITLVETIQEFAEIQLSPSLCALLPLLESVLQLRSLMYQQDVVTGRALLDTISTHAGHADTIKTHNLEQAMRGEAEHCARLMRKVELTNKPVPNTVF
jgi:hypothetical protein